MTGASVSGLSNGKPHLIVRVTARTGTNPIKSFTVTLPPGLHFAQSLATGPQGRLARSQTEVLAVFAPQSSS